MGILMVGVVRLAALIPVPIFVKLIAEIIVGAVFFGVICLGYWIKTKNKFYIILIEPLVRKLFKNSKPKNNRTS